MGVSGAGKSAVGERLARALHARFVEGDDLHPPANRAKMASGTPLSDEDRWPWLDLVGEALREAPVVAACSALRRAYRDRLRSHAPGLVAVHLVASEEVLAERMTRRRGHFMPPALLRSQLATLEPLGPDERGFAVEAASPDEAVRLALAGL
jgi:carbohydrate kinase (thermoresistant glucokinase family)